MEAQDLLQRHRQVFPKFWAWSEAAVRAATLFGHIDMAFGWRVHDGPDTSPLSLQNAPMQGNGAEMMRLAAIAGVRRGVQIDAVVHDAFLIESDADQLEDAVDLHAGRDGLRVQQGAGRSRAEDGRQPGLLAGSLHGFQTGRQVDVEPRDEDLDRAGGGGGGCVYPTANARLPDSKRAPTRVSRYPPGTVILI